MRNKQINLIDVGLDSSFDTSMMFVQSVLENINAGYESPVVDIDFIRTRDLGTVLSAFTSPCNVLHVMAHGDSSITPAFYSGDGMISVSFDDLGAAAADQGRGVSAGAIVADGCRTGTGAWRDAVRDCLQGDVTYIGTSANIGWHESTVFCAAFYGALFRNKGKGMTVGEQAYEAADRAIRAYSLLTDRQCPYRVSLLSPSRRARTLLNR
ncbi:hypothetical protein ACFY36_32110 [Actinoplanes sp. NPDC000266]